ncbi:AN1-type zinc finger protein 2A isoform X1 [Physeter macrocephalus]|uniref:AN1-type zinc finger protein 2A isoform X1 n=1 Tax=Physeter macrocephalus TaxID=9755 RepID=A0A455B1R7_PHYMC|nr:AN1-type zinc finger protein 2A isoform X1 [Physeter catodon]|eukprot:XP_028342038.1 AN1-type zinc finger protein 2A isoform X1 [Physeter catodon]
MEFPDLGKQCSEKTCKQPDFLPLECDACKQDFCKDHFTYAAHKCPFAFKQDVLVPVCPLCNSPIPVKRGEIPDVVVGEHIDGDCEHRPGKKKEGVRPVCVSPLGAGFSSGKKIFTYRCSKEGCRRKEMLRAACSECRGGFCIQHRHPRARGCARGGPPASTAG